MWPRWPEQESPDCPQVGHVLEREDGEVPSDGSQRLCGWGVLVVSKAMGLVIYRTEALRI